MNKITIYKYQTADGMLFDTVEEAVQHEIRSVLISCMEDNTHCGETFKDEAVDEITKRWTFAFGGV